MADFDLAVRKVLAREGGAKVNRDPDDRGGVTKYGISSRAYPDVDVAAMSEFDACRIYKRDYWGRVRGDEITSQLVAENIFDTCVNMGVRTGSRMVQVAAGIEPADGIIGSASLGKLNSIMERTFIALFTIAKIARYASICKRGPSQRKFLLGWINRSLGSMA